VSVTHRLPWLVLLEMPFCGHRVKTKATPGFTKFIYEIRHLSDWINLMWS